MRPLSPAQVDEGEGGLVYIRSIGGDGVDGDMELPLAPHEITKAFRVS